jgi:hypothetical protein
MGVKQTGKAYPKSDALLLMYGILNAEKLDRDYYCHATGISERSFSPLSSTNASFGFPGSTPI